MRYSVDSSALLDGWVRLYPPDIFPNVWDKISELAQNGTLVISEEVMLELQKKDDGISQWVKANFKVYKTDGAIQQAVKEILQKHEKLIDTRKGRLGADPFVIAIAKIENCCVLTGEKPSGQIDRPNIPDVCSILKIKSMNLLDFIREQRWKFSETNQK